MESPVITCHRTGGVLRGLALAAAVIALLQGCDATDQSAEGVVPLTATLQAADAGNDDRFIVAFNNPAGARAALRGAGARIELELPSVGAAAASIPAHAVAALRNNPNIAYIEQDVPRYPLAQVPPYGIGMVQADQVADTASGNVMVCIIDSGYASSHADLPSGTNVTASPDSGSGSPWEDSCGHGTHVAGTIAALDNTEGVVGVLGSGDLNLHIVKVFGEATPADDSDAQNCGWAYSSSLVAALDACQGAAAAGSLPLVVSMSLGGGSKSRTEDRAFAAAYATGSVLSVAAAGNDGNTRKSYPASYSSVISVAAIDRDRNIASFSQQNNAVELAAPGVGVRSTMLSSAHIYAPDSSVEVDGTGYESLAMGGAAVGSVTAPLIDCGLGASPCAATGKVCLIERGDISFGEKVTVCVQGGGVGAIIFNNVAGDLSGTLGGPMSIPAVGITQADGLSMRALVPGGVSATVTLDDSSNYASIQGTSMATPHVSGVAALVWSQFDGASNQDIRDALTASAQDLGTAGRDNAFGFGLVQAAAAVNSLSPGCTFDADCGADDGDACNGVTTCDGGTCVTSAAVICDAGGECSSGSCDPADGQCVYVDIVDGDPCGGAVGACQAGSCSEGACVVSDLPDGTTCDDANECTGTDSCQAGTCISGADLAAGTTCGDGLFCNGAETCDGSGGCGATVLDPCGSELTCNEGTDSCDDPSTCSLKADGAKCKSSSQCCSNYCAVGPGTKGPRCLPAP